ncbi:MAG: S8 family serine peptidase [Tissierellia bacterium]|nr:S8 family serine peptidase [Tissierellia bacterium]
MNKRFIALLLSFLLVLSFGNTNSFADETKAEEYLDCHKIEYDADGFADIIIHLKEIIHRDSGDSKFVSLSSKHSYINDLKERAYSSQKRILEFLEENKANGKVKDFESFYITNAIHIIADSDIVDEILGYPEVDKLEVNRIVKVESMEDLELSGDIDIPWNIDKMNLEEAKSEFGTDGEGVVIGFIDSGVDWTHPSIKNKWRGYDDTTGEIHAEDSWLDLAGNSELPVDNYSHGTAIVSVAVGGEEDCKLVKGIAPGSKWIAVRAFVDKNTTNVNIIKAAEWMLAPAGDPGKAPDIINNSWGGEASSNPWFEDILTAWKSVGIIPIFAAGNSMNEAAKPGSIENPASLLNAFSVGAVDSDLKLTSFSKRGPSSFDSSASIIKPEVVAPGYKIRAAIKNGGYARMYGTSIAAPHISGLAALIKQENRDLNSGEIESILLNSVIPLTDEEYPISPNMGYGHGMPDAYKALKMANKINLMDRISGNNRFQTAVELSRKYYSGGSEAVYITGGYSFTDALVMPILTNLDDGPLLLSGKEDIDDETIIEIKRLSPDNIYIVGGENTISENVKERIISELGIEPERISGKDRFETSIKIADKINSYEKIDRVYLVNGYKEVDAISVSGPSKKDSIPVILTYGDRLESKVKDALIDYGITEVDIIGGENTINDSIVDELLSLGISSNRIGGKDRYQTSLIINKNNYNYADEVFIASGINVVDALTSGAIAGSYKTPVVLVKKDMLPDGVEEYIRNIGYDQLKILGGVNSISDKLKIELSR